MTTVYHYRKLRMRSSFKINISYITETTLTNESKQKRHDSVWANHLVWTVTAGVRRVHHALE